MASDQSRTIPIRVPGDDAPKDPERTGAPEPEEMPGFPDDFAIHDESLTTPDHDERLGHEDQVIAGDGVDVEVVSSDAGRPEEDGAAPAAAPAFGAALASELEELRNELDSTKNRMLRVAADFENFKRRAERERVDAVKFANEEFLKKLIPVMDNLDRAMAHTGGQQDIESLRQGVEMVLRELYKVLEAFGMTAFSALGERFDPAFHEAVLYSESTDVPKGHVMTEYQKGYYLKERLLRPALVVVSKGAPEGAEASPEAEPADASSAAEAETSDEKAP